MRSPGATVRKRLALLMSVFFLLFLCVAARLADLQIVQAQALTQRGMKQWTRSGIVSPKRGGVVDTKGRMLAQSMTSFVLTASPKEIGDPHALAEVLEQELGLACQSGEDLRHLLMIIVIHVHIRPFAKNFLYCSTFSHQSQC